MGTSPLGKGYAFKCWPSATSSDVTDLSKSQALLALFLVIIGLLASEHVGKQLVNATQYSTSAQ